MFCYDFLYSIHSVTYTRKSKDILMSLCFLVTNIALAVQKKNKENIRNFSYLQRSSKLSKYEI